MKRFFRIFAVAAVLLILLFVVHQCGQTNASKYQTTTVTRGPLTQAVTAIGTLNPVVNVQVGSQVSGNIQKLFVDFNSEVKAGQVVAQIDPALFQATLTQAEGDLAHTGTLREKDLFSGRSGSGPGHSSSGGSQRENQTRRLG